MKRLLILLCGLAGAWNALARDPVRFDVPYTVEYGKYVVRVETPVGSRRFIFDTGASRTIISERLNRELGLAAAGSTPVGDFEGHRQTVAYAQMSRLKLGDAVFTDMPVLVLPDSSYIFHCLGFDGIAGSDLLHEFVVRMPNADSTITFANDIRLLGEFDRRGAARIDFVRHCPVVVVDLRNDKSHMKSYMKFDTGSGGLFDCRYDECRALIDRGIACDVRCTKGHSGNLGWTNRSVVREAVRGVIPEFELAGRQLGQMPLEVTHGGISKFGCGIFRWGTVVIDYRGRRFWLLPHAEQPGVPDVPDVPVTNVTFALDCGRLVVGQVWDEALQDVVCPGDRIIRLGTADVEQVDVCMYLRGEIHPDKPEITVERTDGTRVVIPLKKM